MFGKPTFTKNLNVTHNDTHDCNNKKITQHSQLYLHFF